eukprot:8182031-Alexandrium_andersonii.AAC.1
MGSTLLPRSERHGPHVSISSRLQPLGKARPRFGSRLHGPSFVGRPARTTNRCDTTCKRTERSGDT